MSEDGEEFLTKNLKDGQPPKRKTTLNNTNDDDHTSLLHTQIDLSNRKKYIKYGLIAGGFLIVLILIIVILIMVLGDKGEHHDDNPVLPPVLPNSTNEYIVSPFGL
jgi:hypothetical protein